MANNVPDEGIRRAVRLVAILNFTYFGIEFAVARSIGSVSLFADSMDFLEDASVNLLIIIALGWSAQHRARVGMVLAGILLIPGIATLLTAWENSTTLCPGSTTPDAGRAGRLSGQSILCVHAGPLPPSQR